MSTTFDRPIDEYGAAVGFAMHRTALVAGQRGAGSALAHDAARVDDVHGATIVVVSRLSVAARRLRSLAFGNPILVHRARVSFFFRLEPLKKK